MEQGEDGMRAPPKENKEEYHELHFDRAVGLCGGNVWVNGAYDKKKRAMSKGSVSGIEISGGEYPR